MRLPSPRRGASTENDVLGARWMVLIDQRNGLRDSFCPPARAKGIDAGRHHDFFDSIMFGSLQDIPRLIMLTRHTSLLPFADGEGDGNRITWRVTPTVTAITALGSVTSTLTNRHGRGSDDEVRVYHVAVC